MNDTTIKLRRSEFEALYNLYETFVLDDEPTNAGEKLVQTLQLQVWIKLRKLNVEYKPKYKLKLTPAEAQAFVIYWASMAANASHSGILVSNMRNAICENYSISN